MMAAVGVETLQHDCLAQRSHGREDTVRWHQASVWMPELHPGWVSRTSVQVAALRHLVAVRVG